MRKLWSVRPKFLRLQHSKSQSSLAYRVHAVKPDDSYISARRKSAFILHGILGNKSNWRTFAQNTYPAWDFIPVDLRGHGESPSFQVPHSVEACAKDVMGLARDLDLLPEAIIGHSFGGKVALAFLEMCKKTATSSPRQVWVLDVLPGTRSRDYSKPQLTSSVDSVLKAIKATRLPIYSKPQLIQNLQQRGLDISIAQWITTSLRSIVGDPNAYEWTLDVGTIEALFESFLTTDLWPIVENPSLRSSNSEVHFVQAQNNPMWTPQIIERLRKLEPYRVNQHMLPKAGHWVHVDNPSGLLQILQDNWHA